MNLSVMHIILILNYIYYADVMKVDTYHIYDPMTLIHSNMYLCFLCKFYLL